MDDEQAREAAAVLRHVADWELAPSRWDLVDGLLDAMEAALDSGDAEALAAATADLELAGPVRIVRIGSSQPSAAPPLIRERVNQLIHNLSMAPGYGVSSQESGAGPHSGREAE